MKPVMQWLEKGGEICPDNCLKLPPDKIYTGLAEYFAFSSSQRSLYSSTAVKEDKALSQICALLCLLHKKSILSSSEYENYTYGLTVPINIFGDEILSFRQDGVSQPLEDWLNRDRDNIDIITVYSNTLKFKEKLNKIKKFIVLISENDILSNIINTIEMRSFLEDMKNYPDTEIAITERIADMEDKQNDVMPLKNVLQANKLGWSNEKIACVNSFIISEL